MNIKGEKQTFLQKNFGEIFWLIFKKNPAKTLHFGQKTTYFNRVWKN